jgi:hypothetical protein
MKTLKVLTAAAGVLLAVTAPALAASAKQRVHRGYNAYASDAVSVDRSGAYSYGAYSYGPIGGRPVLTPAQHNYNAPSGNLPYPDRPYGDPDRW